MEKFLSNLTFRQIYQQLIYIEDEKLLNIMKMGYQVKSSFEETGLLVYGYIDEDEGVLFNIFSLVRKEGDSFKFNDEPMKKKLKHKIKFEDVKDSKAQNIELDPDEAIRYVDRAVEINKEHEVSDEIMNLRLNTQIDQFRHQIYPDNLECFIFDAQRKASKSFWARAEKQNQDYLIASVLTPLPKEMGYAIGDAIKLKLYQYKDSTRLIHVLNQRFQ